MQFWDFSIMQKLSGLFLFAILISGASSSGFAFAQVGPIAVDGVTQAILWLYFSIQTLSIQICNKEGISIPSLNGIAEIIPIERINGISAKIISFTKWRKTQKAN